MSDTDKTAEAILDKSEGIVTFTNGKVYGSKPTVTETGLQGLPYRLSEEWTLADLQRMAKLWLMRGEIIKEMTGNREPYALAEIANKIKALEKE